MSRSASTWLVAALLAVAGSAHGQNVQNFDPAAGTWNYLSLEGARTASHLEFVPSLYINYGANPLLERDTATGRVVDEVVNQLITFDLILTLGLFDRVEVAVDVPFNLVYGSLLGQRDDGFALGDLRITPKIRLFGLETLNDRGVGLALVIPMTLPTGDPDAFVGADQFTLNPKAVLEAHVSKVRLAANLGVRVRPEKKVLSELELSHELTYGAGVDFDLADDYVHLLAEVFGAAAIADINPKANANPLEMLVAARIFTPAGPVFTIGGGLGLIPDYGTPLYRVLVGFAWDKRELDRDGDGILDYDDQCPDDPEDKDEFQDEDGCPDPDNDEDGILDVDDECPLDPEDRDGFEDDDGCPDQGEVKVKVEAEKIEIYEKIYFELDKAIIRPISFSILDQVVRVVVRNPQIKKIRIEGHTDSQGTDEYNLDLSKRRAAAVMEYLTTAGVDPARLTSEGYGEGQPIDTNDTREGRANNRRVEFKILEQEPVPEP